MISIEIVGTNDRKLFASQLQYGDWVVTIDHDPTDNCGAMKLCQEVDQFMEAGFTRTILFLEDCVLVIPEPGTLVGFDTITGHRELSIGVHALNVMAIVQLAVCGDEHPQAVELYPLAEEAIKGWATECRPIP